MVSNASILFSQRGGQRVWREEGIFEVCTKSTDPEQWDSKVSQPGFDLHFRKMKP
jgi:hypothetical protein